MNDRETIPEILDDMRKAGALMPAVYMRDLHNYADRLTAAHERERETWRGRVKDALAVADQFKGALDHVLNAALFAQQKKGEMSER